MKIATVTDDGATICAHFGRARLYAVLTVENGVITNREMRPKAGHHTFGGEHADHGSPTEQETKHATMFDTVADCQAVLTGGMGSSAYESFASRGIQPVVTDVADIEAATRLYASGALPNLTALLH